ncbi:MAG: integral membrane sensor signal transduction histidine kinase [Limisphaerales bacterium]|nr:MAG: integral membrane sensor signal transduction histidine kinase [Limisphaerales bacterium]KAG0510204.1 MAG: integral membrane sensor signal transduction histidine kinase [Limisphaerales bacterium]TXT51913.1 MAG: integral membrane sensor signal transduction histidine kinase [Limisphaerales bacterium]
MLTHSLRWRLQVWHGLLLLIVLVTFGCTAYYLVLDNRLRRVDQELQRRALPLAGMFGRFGGPGSAGERPPGNFRIFRDRVDPGDSAPGEPRSPDGKRPEGRSGFGFGPDGARGSFSGDFRQPPDMPSPFEDAVASGYYIVAWSREGEELRRSTNAPPELSVPEMETAADTALARTRGEFREFALRTRAGSLVLVGHDIAPDLAELRRLGWLLSLVGGGVLLLGLAGGWWLAARAIRPIEDISQTAVKIAGGNLAERIQVTDPADELGRLAGVLNSTFTRLEAAFAQQKQFTADAAHELRTPIAVLISEAQTTLARERTPGEYREAVQECLAVAQQMRRLTESLLDLSRFDSGHERMECKPVDLVALVGETLALVQPLAEQRNVRLAFDPEHATCLGDAQRLGQIATNLLTNAICYNRPGGEVRVRTAATASHVLLEVHDTGQGIAAEDLPHLFERFYRADKARTRSAGHAGLGLAICKAIVDAHGGTLAVTSQPGVGSTFAVRLPAA